MKIRFYLLICLSLFASTLAFSVSANPQQSLIEVTGIARIYIPIDQVSLRITSQEKKTATAAEQKIYHLGMKLKDIFKEFKITEKAIPKSDIRVYDNEYYDDNNKLRVGYFCFN